MSLILQRYQQSTPVAKAKKRKSIGAAIKSSKSPKSATIQPGDELTVILSDGSHTRQIQDSLVVRLISSIGHRWNNATCDGRAIPMMREVIVSKDIGGFGAHYEQLRIQGMKSEKHLITKLRASHQHAVKNHRGYLRQIISRLFEKTSDSKMNFVKDSVFGVRGGATIIGLDHPVVKGMMQSIKGKIHVSILTCGMLLTHGP
jgi:hypothetical protein